MTLFERHWEVTWHYLDVIEMLGIVNMDLILGIVTSNNVIMMTKNIRNDIKQTSNWHYLMIFDINLMS